MLFQKQLNYVEEKYKVCRIETESNCLEGWGQNRKIFVSLIEKIFARGRLKNVEKIFLFCSAVRRAETLGGSIGPAQMLHIMRGRRHPLDFAQRKF